MSDDHHTARSSKKVGTGGIFQFLQDLGPYVVYYPRLARGLCGSVNAGILLCFFIGWAGKGKDPDGWIWKTASEMEEETGLSRREQEGARQKLRAKGFLAERYADTPRKLYYRINVQKVNSAWENCQSFQDNAQNRHTCMANTDAQVSTKWTCKYPQKRRPNTTSTATQQKTTTTEPTPHPDVVDDVEKEIKRLSLGGLLARWPSADIMAAVNKARSQYSGKKITNLGGLVRTMLEAKPTVGCSDQGAAVAEIRTADLWPTRRVANSHEAKWAQSGVVAEKVVEKIMEVSFGKITEDR